LSVTALVPVVVFVSLDHETDIGAATMSQQDDNCSSTSVSCPVVLPEKVNGGNNFNEWISHFEGIAAINKWTDEEKKLWLGIRLTDKAHVAFTRLPTEAHQSYSALKTALTKRFEPTSKQEVLKQNSKVVERVRLRVGVILGMNFSS